MHDPLRNVRLQKAREHARYSSARAAALDNNWPESTYRAHEKGTRTIGADDAHRYGEAFGVRGEWIFSGKGEMIPQKAEPFLSNASAPFSSRQLSTRRIPVYGQAVGGEDGRFDMNGIMIDTIFCPPGLEDVTDAYAIYVVGDSMVPRFESGEPAWVHPRMPVRKGDDVVVQLKAAAEGDPPQGLVKRLVALTPSFVVLQQFNPPKEIRFSRADIVSIHKIVFAGRK